MEQAVPRVPGYQVETPLGTGSSATVWRARREADGLLLALKVVRVGAEGVGRAMREAAVLSRVRHRHLVHLYDVLPLPGADGRPEAVALAVQLAEGGSLAQVLHSRHHLSAGEVVTVLAPLAGALADLHRAGVVHGDLSPGNVLFLANGMPLLGDLGVCRVAGDARGPLDATDGMIAPEVLEGYPPSADTDVYGLGALAWTCLVGQAPGWVASRLPLEDLAPDVPAAMRELVAACLAPEPAERPHAEEVAVAMFAAAEAVPVEVAPDADPAAGLTRRLRERARAEVDPDASTGGTGDGQRGSRRGRLGRRRAERTSGPRATLGVGGRADGTDRRRGRRTSGPGAGQSRGRRTDESGEAAPDHPLRLRAAEPPRARRGRRVAVVLGSVAVAAAITAAAAAWAASGPGNPDAVPDSGDAAVTPGAVGDLPASTTAAPDAAPTSRAAPETGGHASASPEPGSGPERPPDAPAIQALLEARASAWVEGDVEALSDALATGSPALTQDAGELARAVAAGYRYEGLAFRLDEHAVTEEEHAVTEEEDSVCVVEAVVVRSAITIAATGERAVEHPEESEEVRLELRWMQDGWRIWSWS